MRKLVLAAVLVLMAGGAQASSYLQLGGNVVDPILTTSGAVHWYSGTNLQPGANLADADLAYAYLTNANLGSSNLSYANLNGANLSNADLTGANLAGAILYFAYGLSTTTGIPDYDALTNFTGTGFDPVAAGWNLVPEPSTALLMGLGLFGLAARKEMRSRLQQ